MNRKNLTAAVLAGLAGAAGIVGSAQAVNINPDGVGQVLIYPYYTTNAGNQTFFSVVNTTGNAKAVKVRFLEGQNSREVLDFNLYMSAFDVWAAAVFMDGVTPSIVVPDNSCTVPYIHEFAESTQAFLPYAFGTGDTDTSIGRAAEGHFEMLEMGTLTNATNASATAATHVSGVPPVSTNAASGTTGICQQLVGAWSTSASGTQGYWLLNRTTDLSAPSGGLFGSAGVVNVAEGALYSYDAIALNNWSQSLWTDGGGTGFTNFPLHSIPGSTQPNLNSGDQLTGTLFLSTAVAAAGAVTSPTFARGVDAVSYTFMRDSIMNEYTTQAAVLAKTEWVVTFPTKNFYVDPTVSGSATVVEPFTDLWDGTNACEPVTLTIWDRNEQIEEGTIAPPDVSPQPPVPPSAIVELCFETNVIMFGDTTGNLLTERSGLLGSNDGISIDTATLGFENGWMKLAMNPTKNVSGVTTRTDLGLLYGLPVTGFQLSEFTNGAAQEGLKATYGGLWQHKYTRLCSVGNPAINSFACPSASATTTGG